MPYSKFLVGIIYIACKQENADLYLQPIFSVFEKGDPIDACKSTRRFVDLHKRSYKNWEDWKENNVLPPMEYAFPRYGFFSCSQKYKYEFDEDKDPNIEFGESPQNSLGSKFLRGTDITTGITSLVCGGIAVASFFTPIGPAIMLGTAITGGASALWGTGRFVLWFFWG